MQAGLTQLLNAGLAGFFLSASLIIAIGAQNAFILRMGLAGTHVFILCLVCALSDAALITLGIAGMGAFVSQSPVLLKSITYGGAAFLLFYAFLAARRALKPQGEGLEVARGRLGLVPALAQCLAFTFLNPHVYLDTLVLVGAYSLAHEGIARLAFGAGAVTASFVWFFLLGYAASMLTPVFASALAWRILDASIALVMTVLAVLLAIAMPV